MAAILTSREAYEWHATVTINALTSYVIGRNSNVPNRNHFIIASIASTCALLTFSLLSLHAAESIHKKTGKTDKNFIFLEAAIFIPTYTLANFIFARFAPLQLPPVAATLGYLAIIPAISFPVIALGKYFIPENRVENQPGV